uniref:Putative secreted protein n=1 Tax=Ixodes ricinus TaxID=34613 RepID=V5ICL3_IXORI
MKATLVAICFIAAVRLLHGETDCSNNAEPLCHYTSCAANANLRIVYTFRNHTNKCERMLTCAEGINHFEKPECC